MYKDSGSARRGSERSPESSTDTLRSHAVLKFQRSHAGVEVSEAARTIMKIMNLSLSLYTYIYI